ncbi:MAG TPA: hypothetical protein PK358_09935, partial [Spirochaetota bacterium]|nr:hypothetical protein [Spirochaetota bacterium]
IAAQSFEIAAQSFEIAAQSSEIAAQSSEIAAQSSGIAAQSSEIAAQSSEVHPGTIIIASEISIYSLTFFRKKMLYYPRRLRRRGYIIFTFYTKIYIQVLLLF